MHKICLEKLALIGVVLHAFSTVFVSSFSNIPESKSGHEKHPRSNTEEEANFSTLSIGFILGMKSP